LGQNHVDVLDTSPVLQVNLIDHMTFRVCLCTLTVASQVFLSITELNALVVDTEAHAIDGDITPLLAVLHCD